MYILLHNLVYWVRSVHEENNNVPCGTSSLPRSHLSLFQQAKEIPGGSSNLLEIAKVSPKSCISSCHLVGAVWYLQILTTQLICCKFTKLLTNNWIRQGGESECQIVLKTSEMDLFWCISMTNNVKSCKKPMEGPKISDLFLVGS